MINIWTKTGL